jgi:hypothetical protein
LMAKIGTERTATESTEGNKRDGTKQK